MTDTIAAEPSARRRPAATRARAGRRALALGAALALLLPACSDDDGAAPPATSDTSTDTATDAPAAGPADGPDGPTADGCGTALPPEVVAAADEWPSPNGDERNTRAVLGSPITAETIGDLEEAWSYDVPGSAAFGNLTTNPVVLDGTVYVGALDGSTHAVDLATGERAWAHEREVSIFGPAGVAVGWGLVFGISDTATVVAQAVDDGTVAWEADLQVHDGNQVDMAPALVGGCVLVSTQALAAGSRGTLYALDHATGDVVWQVETVPDDFWGDPTVNHGGGAWYPPAVDTTTGTSYWGTSNPWPSPGAPGAPAGASRPGANEDTNSLLAIGPDGAVAWKHQVFAHDIWDRDMVLTALTEDGEGTQVVVHTGKGGHVLAYDLDGTVRWEVEVGLHENDDLTTFDEPTTVMPGVLGGVETPPAYADGVGYFSVVNAPSTYDSPEDMFNLSPQLGTHPSHLVALDLTTGEELWSADLPGDGLGAATVVSDLVLTSTYGGTLLAYDRATGEEVWRHEAGASVNGWPAVVGDTIVWPVSGGEVSRLATFRLP